ncbi:MAG: hypothetical protein M1817_001367 [Caeruleum heppii]|nr:MAG: hypothetical protein M1817_001367 [Caeruleum heppii]
MSSPPTAAPLATDEIAAFSDGELVQFMAKHRTADGGFQLPVEGWDKLPEDERTHLAERLKAQQQALAQSPIPSAHKLDLDQIDAHLRELSSDNRNTLHHRPRIIDRSRSPTGSLPDEGDMGRDWETDAYNDLVNDGGRPLYPIGLLEQVSRNWEEHSELLQPWLGRLKPSEIRDPDFCETGSRPWEVFQMQRKRWEGFRNWQNDNRKLDDDEGAYLTFVERMKRVPKCLHGTKEAEMEADPSFYQSCWKQRRRIREWKRYHHRESECDARVSEGFPGYVNAVKGRLARHGFTRLFQLQEDPKQQDKLTTWIEYLNFECWWLDRYTRAIERWEPVHEKAWQKLLDARVLRPYETKESVRTHAASLQASAAENLAREALHKARLNAERVYTLTQLDSSRLTISRPQRIRLLHAATHGIWSAEDSLASITRRNWLITDFIRGTFGFTDAKRNTAVQNARCQWILEQVPLLEADLIESETTQAGSSDGDSIGNYWQSPLLSGKRSAIPAKGEQKHTQTSFMAVVGGLPLQGGPLELEQAEISARSRKRSRAEEKVWDDSGEPSGKSRKTTKPAAADSPVCHAPSPATARESEHPARPSKQKSVEDKRAKMFHPAPHVHVSITGLQAPMTELHKPGDDRGLLAPSQTGTLCRQSESTDYGRRESIKACAAFKGDERQTEGDEKREAQANGIIQQGTRAATRLCGDGDAQYHKQTETEA